MRKLLPLLLLQIFVFIKVQSQSFNVNELLKLAYLPSKNIDTYLQKKGFYFFNNNDADSITAIASFVQKRDIYETAIGCKRSIDIAIKPDSKKLTFYTTVFKEYKLGQQWLIKEGFLYDANKNLFKDSIIFQKANITFKASMVEAGKITTYRFDLFEQTIPSSIRFAEDLLQFDSHQFLVSYFGENNVKSDRYYLTEKELKKCTVLFSGTPRQVIFVWNDEIYLNNLAYIIISNRPPTEESLKNDPLPGNNEWQLKNGIYPGMGLKELLRINEIDFSIYGKKSDLAFLVKPDDSGKINFRKTALMLSCPYCYDDQMFDQKEVSALALAKANLPMRVFDVVLYTYNR